YARGMSGREIQAFLLETYATDVSPELISEVTDEVVAETVAWPNRPLARMYPVHFFDAPRVKICTDGLVVNKAIDLTLEIDANGERDVLGLWIEHTEGTKFWLKVFNEPRNRGCQERGSAHRGMGRCRGGPQAGRTARMQYAWRRSLVFGAEHDE